MQYYLSKFVDCGFDEACERVRQAAGAQGFGMPMELDFTALLREKLGAELRAYRVLGSCMPRLAFEALETEPHIGLLLPCNWVVQELEDGRIEVSVMEPRVLVEATGNETLAGPAEEARQRILAALDAI